MKTLATLATLACFSFLAIAGEPAAPDPRTFRTDAEGFILNWLVLEPIRLNSLQHTEAAIRAIVTRDELKEPLMALPRGGDKATAEGTNFLWHSLDAKNYLVSLTGFASEQGKPTVSVIFYGVAYVIAPDDMKDVRLAIGSDDDSIWWVNGKEAISAFGVRQTSTDDNVSKRLTLNKGVNVVRFAVIQGDGPSDCCARFFDARQKPITNISVSLDPPAAPGK
jgi:hypothetical protein